MDKKGNAVGQDSDGSDVRRARQDALVAFASLLAKLVAGKLGSVSGARRHPADIRQTGSQEHATSVH